MNRREFTATALASLLPSWLVAPARRKRIDLAAFCSKHDWPSWVLRKPFRQGDWTYATDGHVCVRVRPESGDVDSEAVKLPPANALPYWDHDSIRGWQTPRVEILEATDICENADGADGHDICFCGKCDRGIVVRPRLVRVNGHYFDREQWDKFAALDAEIAFAGGSPPKHSSLPPMRIRFDGGDGLLMPIDAVQAVKDIAEAIKWRKQGWAA